MDDFSAPASHVRAHVMSTGGLALAVSAQGPVEAPPVLFAHGFGQSRHAWTRTAHTLAARSWRTVTFDFRGHGDSNRVADGQYRMEQFIDDLLAVAGSLAERPVLVGASMGGLLGLVAAGELRPSPFRALVLVDITPRWEAQGIERMLDFMRLHADGFASLDEAAAAVAAYLPQRGQRADHAALAERLQRGPDGRLRWRWDPALLATIAPLADAYRPRIVAAARHVDVPTLLVTGGRSDVTSDAGVAEFLRLVPDARHVVVADAAHTLAGDDNAAFAGAIEPFLDALIAGGTVLLDTRKPA
jgi:pimeloyl-ACP methyl ester carboxylesterase